MKARFLTISEGVSFLKRQHHDWMVTVARSSIDRFDYQMVFPYLSIYIVALGATATQLGLVNALGMTLAGLLAPLTGWSIDRIGPKIYMIGIGLVAISYLTYALAQNWMMTIMAMMAYWFGYSASVHSCGTVCGKCLANEDRATGMMICETAAAGLLGMAGPMIGAWVVTGFGGVNVNGIRPLFFIAMAGTIASFVMVSTKLSGNRYRPAIKGRPNVLGDMRQVLREGHHLKRFLAIATVSYMPTGMVFPFSMVFAHEIKGADQYVLGMMVTGSALTSILLAIPLGRLADRLGRKRSLYISIPAFWISTLLLVWAPNTAFLVIAGILQGFYYIGQPIAGAMERELVPADQMGRWLGITRFCRLVVNGGFVLLAGVIWDRIGPVYVFMTFLAIDMLVRMPLLITMPETLSLKLRSTPGN